MAFKADIGRCFLSEYGFSFENHIRRQPFLHSKTGYYNHDTYYNHLPPEKAKMNPFRKAWLFVVNDDKKYYQLSAAFTHRDFFTQKEILQGVSFRASVRRYFSKQEMAGFYLSLGIGYSIYFARAYNDYYSTLAVGTLHRLPLTLPIVGYHWRIGGLKSFSLDTYISPEWSYVIQSQIPPWYQIKSLRQNWGVYAGVQIGIAYHHKKGIW